MMLWPEDPNVARLIALALAPVQWGMAWWYLRYWDLFPKMSIKRLVPWCLVFLLNVVIPVAIYRANSAAMYPDIVVSTIVFVDGIVFIVLLFFMLRGRSRSLQQ